MKLDFIFCLDDDVISVQVTVWIMFGLY